MNSRQRRKKWYDEHHEAPIKNHWVKTSEFGKIGECNPDSKYYKKMKQSQDRERFLKYELKAMGLWSKHTGSSKHSKLRAALKQRVALYHQYSDIIKTYAENMQNAEDFVETPIVEMPESIQEPEVIE